MNRVGRESNRPPHRRSEPRVAATVAPGIPRRPLPTLPTPQVGLPVTRPAGRLVQRTPAAFAIAPLGHVHTPGGEGVAWPEKGPLPSSRSLLPGSDPYTRSAPISDPGFFMTNAKGGHETSGREILALGTVASGLALRAEGPAAAWDIFAMPAR